MTPVATPISAAGIAAQATGSSKPGQPKPGKPKPRKDSVTVAGCTTLRPQPPKTSSPITTPKLMPRTMRNAPSPSGASIAMASAVEIAASEGGCARTSMKTRCQTVTTSSARPSCASAPAPPNHSQNSISGR